MNKDLLLIFVRNPILNKVKTRLAATIGPHKALAVYETLLSRTQAITHNLPVTKIVYYADFVPENDRWTTPEYQKRRQAGQDLGERMYNAFAQGFADGFQQICIIGSDCYELTPDIITTAFTTLANKDVVLGPATDGGYYLLGLNKLHKPLFRHINWSTPAVLAQTLSAVQENNLSVGLLPTLTDVDEEKDLMTMPDVY